MENLEMTRFYKGKRVLVTGHTGFKGAWLCRVLLALGAEVTGYALAPQGENLFELCGIDESIRSVTGDIRDAEKLRAVFAQSQPEIILHLAAQPLVLEGYRNPWETFCVNVMGTVTLLDCARSCESVRSIVNVTTDKVYRNEEWPWGYRETDTLGGRDPYCASKACSELATDCYRDSFFADTRAGVSTMRAGNVIGGGDFAPDRLIPDCLRAALDGRPVVLRYPGAVRPYQHVLEPLFAYLLLAMRQYQDPALAGSYNVGPGDAGCVSNAQLAELFCRYWGDGMTWLSGGEKPFHEAGLLRLDGSKIRSVLGWQPHWDIETAVRKTVEWMKARAGGADAAALTDRQIGEYLKGGGADV